jgi:hypothetical protein
MSIALEFESKLLQLLEDEIPNHTEIRRGDTTTIKNVVFVEPDPIKLHTEYNESEINSPRVIPQAVTLFLGICIGVGLASHALIVKWK